MKILTESEIIRLMREEWDARLQQLSEEVELKTDVKVDGQNQEVIGRDLVVRHIASGLEYIVDTVGDHDVTLCVFPGGEKLIINKDELEKEYEIP